MALLWRVQCWAAGFHLKGMPLLIAMMPGTQPMSPTYHLLCVITTVHYFNTGEDKAQVSCLPGRASHHLLLVLQTSMSEHVNVIAEAFRSCADAYC